MPTENDYYEQQLRSQIEQSRKVDLTPSEQEARDLEKQLAGYEGRLRDLESGDPTKIESVYTLEGFSPISSRPMTPQEQAQYNADRAASGPLGFLKSGGGADFGGRKTIGDPFETVKGSLESKVQGIRGQLAGLKERVISEKLDRLGQREAELGGEVVTTQRNLNQAIDMRLKDALAELGFGADVARSQVGAAFAGRGLNRSTFAGRGVEAVTLQEQAGRGREQLQSSLQKSKIATELGGQFKKLGQARSRAETERTLQSIQNAEDIMFAFDEQALKQKYQQELADMELNSEETNLFGALVGAAVGGTAGFFAGGPMGAAAGASIGGSVGSTL